MPDFTIEDMNNVLKRANAPGGDGNLMHQFIPGLESSVRGAMPNQANPAIDANKQAYMDQIHQIALMDQKLAGVYGNPSSPMYIKKGLTREKLISGSSTTGYRAAGGIKSLIGKQKATDIKDTNSKVADVISYYKQLTSLQDREERLNDKQAKQNVASIKKQKGEAAKALGMTVAEADQVSLAGVYDHEAINVFLQAPAAFKKLWVRNMAVGGGEPEDGFSVKDIQDNLDAYNADTKKKKATASSSSTEDLGDLLKEYAASKVKK